MRRLVPLVAVVVLAAASASAAARPAWDLVWRSERASSSISLTGTVRTRMAEGEEPHSAVARVWGGGGKLRLDYEAGRFRWTVIDDGRRLIRLDPRRRDALVLPRPRLVVDKRLAERNYHALLVGRERVAGRPTHVVEIRPVKHPGGGQVVWRLWLDEQTGFALRRERYTAEGRLATSSEYVEVEYGRQPDPGLFSVPPGFRIVEADGNGRETDVEELERRLGIRLLRPGYLPAGYEYLGSYLQRRSRWGWEAAELRYSDGVRLLSLFQHPGERVHGGGGRRHRGGRRPPAPAPESEREGRHGRGRGGRLRHGLGPPRPGEMDLVDRGSEKVLRLLVKDRVVVLVGDLPPEELMRMARSLQDGAG